MVHNEDYPHKSGFTAILAYPQYRGASPTSVELSSLI